MQNLSERSQKRRVYAAAIAGQLLVVVAFIAFGIVEFTIGNLAIMAVIGWTSFIAVRFVLNSVLIEEI